MSKKYELDISDKDIEFVDESSNDVKVSLDLLPVSKSDVGATVEVKFDEDTDGVVHSYVIASVSNTDVTLSWKEMLENTPSKKILTEDPDVMLDADDMFDPTRIDLKQKLKAAQEKERAEQEAAKQAEESKKLKEKYQEEIENIQNIFNKQLSTEDTLQEVFNELVPPSGIAETVAGELVRATMRLLYRDYNDGDKFFEGYGLETCGGSAAYLMDNGFEEEITNMVDDALRLSDNDDAYTRELFALAEAVLYAIKEDETLILTPNTVDSRSYDNSFMVEHQPRYELEIPASTDICQLVEERVLTSWDLIDYVKDQLEWSSVYNDCEVSRPWGHHDCSVTVENMTKDAYDLLHESAVIRNDDFWQGLLDEHADELNMSDDDIDEDELED